MHFDIIYHKLYTCICYNLVIPIQNQCFGVYIINILHIFQSNYIDIIIDLAHLTNNSKLCSIRILIIIYRLG